MKQVVLKVELYDDKTKRKAMKKVSGVYGVNSYSLDTRNQTLTITGDMDPVAVVMKLRKLCRVDMLYVETAEEESEEEEPQEEEEPEESEDVERIVTLYEQSRPQYPQYYYYMPAEQEPDRGCVIC